MSSTRTVVLLSATLLAVIANVFLYVVAQLHGANVQVRAPQVRRRGG